MLQRSAAKLKSSWTSDNIYRSNTDKTINGIRKMIHHRIERSNYCLIRKWCLSSWKWSTLLAWFMFLKDWYKQHNILLHSESNVVLACTNINPSTLIFHWAPISTKRPHFLTYYLHSQMRNRFWMIYFTFLYMWKFNWKIVPQYYGN